MMKLRKRSETDRADYFEQKFIEVTSELNSLQSKLDGAEAAIESLVRMVRGWDLSKTFREDRELLEWLEENASND